MTRWNNSARKTGRPLLTLAAALVVGLVVALPAGASDSLAFDTGPTSAQGYYASAPTFAPASQTFVATASGALTRVSVLMNKRASDGNTYQDICATYNWQPMTVQLHPAAADNSSIDLGTVLASAQIQPGDVPCTPNARGDGYPPVDVVFSQPATLTAGSHYALTFVDNNYPSNPAPGIYQLALGLNSYADGDFWSGGLRYSAANTGGYAYDLVLRGYIGTSDSTPPSLSVSHSGDGLSGWNLNAAVSLSISASDSGSGLAAAPACTDNGSPLSVTGSAPFFVATVTGEGPHAISCSVSDNAGNPATAGDAVEIDSLGPLATLLGPADGGSYTLGAVPGAGCSTSDPGAPATGSGVAAPASLSLSGGTANGVGSFTASCSGATDVAGNTQGNVAKASYNVGYASGGFLAPVNNAPTVNTGKAGKTYPVKWQLRDANGSFISSLTAVASIGFKAASCSNFATDPTDALEQSTTGGTALRYDATAHQYVYNWATPAKGCYTLSLTLDSGQVYRAYFNLS